MSGFCQERPLPSPTTTTPEHRWLGLFSPQSQEGITLDHIQLEASHPGLQCPLHWLEGGSRGEDRVTRPHAGLPERKGVGTEAQGSPSPHGHLSASSQRHGHQRALPVVSWSCLITLALIRTSARLI